jgi:hypothetical protein
MDAYGRTHAKAVPLAVARDLANRIVQKQRLLSYEVPVSQLVSLSVLRIMYVLWNNVARAANCYL